MHTPHTATLRYDDSHWFANVNLWIQFFFCRSPSTVFFLFYCSIILPSQMPCQSQPTTWVERSDDARPKEIDSLNGRSTRPDTTTSQLNTARTGLDWYGAHNNAHVVYTTRYTNYIGIWHTPPMLYVIYIHSGLCCVLVLSKYWLKW